MKPVHAAVMLFFCLILLIPVSCGKPQSTEKQEIVARINDFELTRKEYLRLLTAELEMNPEFKLTREAKKAFLDEIIRKELLIQEAKRLQLDRNEKFIRAIERYWESLLIRDLMELKGREISGMTAVSLEECHECYERLRKNGAAEGSFEDMEKEILEMEKERKKTRLFQQWMDSLRESANIEVNESVLYKD